MSTRGQAIRSAPHPAGYDTIRISSFFPLIRHRLANDEEGEDPHRKSLRHERMPSARPFTARTRTSGRSGSRPRLSARRFVLRIAPRTRSRTNRCPSATPPSSRSPSRSRLPAGLLVHGRRIDAVVGLASPAVERPASSFSAALADTLAPQGARRTSGRLQQSSTFPHHAGCRPPPRPAACAQLYARATVRRIGSASRHSQRSSRAARLRSQQVWELAGASSQRMA